MILKGFAWLENDVSVYNLSVFKHRVYLYNVTHPFIFDFAIIWLLDLWSA